MLTNIDGAREFTAWTLKEKENGKRESASGPGSTMKSARPSIDFLTKILSKYDIRSICDLGCGDFNWMSKVHIGDNVKYNGYDCSDTMIQENKLKYGKLHHIDFHVADICQMEIPENVDLVICRDVLFHMDMRIAKNIIDRIRNAGCRYLLSTSYPNAKNTNIRQYTNHILSKNWGFYEINLDIAPFELRSAQIEFVSEPLNQNRNICLYRMNHSHVNINDIVHQSESPLPPLLIPNDLAGIKVLIINLEERKDRWKRIYQHLIDDIGLSPHQIIRIDAIKHHNGHLGCGRSHIKALKYAIENNLEKVVILEDDTYINERNAFRQMLDRVSSLKSCVAIDVVFLMIHAVTNPLSVAKLSPPSTDMLRIYSGCSTGGMFYTSREAMEKMLQIFETTISSRHWFVDRCWWRASRQNKVYTYIYLPYVANTIDDKSNIAKRIYNPSKWMNRTEDKLVAFVNQEQSEGTLDINLPV
jgi:GR25 family glycosyltransferase involved in LPS biosynthesis